MGRLWEDGGWGGLEFKGGTLVGGIWRENSSRMRTLNRLHSEVFASCAASQINHFPVCNYTLVRNGSPVPLRRVGRISTLQGAAFLHLQSKKIQYPISHMTGIQSQH